MESEPVSAVQLVHSPVFTLSASGTVSCRPSLNVMAFAVLSTLFAVILLGAMYVAFTPLGVLRCSGLLGLNSRLFLQTQQHFPNVVDATARCE